MSWRSIDKALVPAVRYRNAHHKDRGILYDAAALREEQISTMRKSSWWLAAFAVGIAAYAVHGLVVDDLAIPYDWWGRGYTHTRLLHLHGAWAVAGAVCLLVGAIGFAILFVGQLNAKRGAEPFRKLAIGLVAVGVVFFLTVCMLTQWFIE